MHRGLNPSRSALGKNMNPESNATPDSPDTSDASLFAAVQAGELNAFEGIMRRNNQRLFRIARSIVTDDSEAMDVVQETYVAAYQKLDDLNDATLLSNWLAKITRNTALMRIRKNQRMQLMDDSGMDNVMNLFGPEKPANEPDRALANVQLGRLLEKFIDELPESFRTVFMLRAVEQCSVCATAEILDMEPATVKTRYHRAKKLLQNRLLDFGATSGLKVHEFAGHRCNTVVRKVMSRLRSMSFTPDGP
jgi:RNA polymerase sigma-70 factor (ECF subfamily)